MQNIYESRARDYQNEFRKMVYDSDAEMNKVLGRLEDNSFIREQQGELEAFSKKINSLLEKFDR